MRILAIDYGSKRLGMALSDAMGMSANPYPYLPNDKFMWDKLCAFIKDKEVAEVVIGLPITMKGTASEMTEEAEKFAKQLESKITIPIILQDERLSTMESEKFLISANVSREKRKEVRDSMAACLILQDYLERRGS